MMHKQLKVLDCMKQHMIVYDPNGSNQCKESIYWSDECLQGYLTECKIEKGKLYNNMMILIMKMRKITTKMKTNMNKTDCEKKHVKSIYCNILILKFTRIVLYLQSYKKWYCNWKSIWWDRALCWEWQ